MILIKKIQLVKSEVELKQILPLTIIFTQISCVNNRRPARDIYVSIDKREVSPIVTMAEWGSYFLQFCIFLMICSHVNGKL